jgi:hypothetical protein
MRILVTGGAGVTPPLRRYREAAPLPRGGVESGGSQREREEE